MLAYAPPQFPRLEIDCASCDVTRPDSCAELHEFVHARYGGRRLGWVAANAGILLTRSTVLHGTESEWRSTYAVRERHRKGGHTVYAGVRACGCWVLGVCMWVCCLLLCAWIMSSRREEEKDPPFCIFCYLHCCTVVMLTMIRSL